MIYVIEGPDGTGKSTLAKALSDKIKAITIHSSYDPAWKIWMCHNKIMSSAVSLSRLGVPVILDRWAVSEEVYGTIFRNGPGYDTQELIEQYEEHIVWIYCRNDNAVENHQTNSRERVEMFDDMERVVEMFDEYVAKSSLNWHIFDFDKVTTEDFLKEIINTAGGD